MAKSSGSYVIPFNANGDQLHYPDSWGVYSVATWADNEDFDDTLTFGNYRRGRSAAYFHFTRADGRGVTMFLKEFTEAVPHMERGVLRGRFRFIKRGANYGCMLLEPSA